ncbi:hypothetical protein FNF27_04803 [Cafeteria roenbergensis]|uniref:COP9 signalosome complex subunit 3 n=1 Tax=Cafeteria roenbergensis TaxID=33653 RepID=A0A5A8CE68_CAFRO|nr:hypothetical protein FNF29_05372 [Cafeteria roenbergensis]KAA0160273.1 hypothetical protein FNF31_04438 [Cafeteria roenbergensis]KAA0160707.1 hypothetical protein FNF28_05343 [Cafeteria roenbergensis]KAA0173653.1 hypothetical protein FNF27_04803 [Cafeteria roenbergensis]|eukprot:KAA0150360.1 hypothetical protein FNF29_05372 [Cafeteria roenbergensis]
MASDAGEIKLDPVNPRTENGRQFLDTVSRMAQADLRDLHRYAGMLAHKATLESISRVGSGAVVVLGEAISLPEHTASYACILYTAEPILHRQGHTALFVRFALSLFSEGDRRQLRAVPAFVASIARALGQHARSLGAASAAMRAITRAAEATAPNPHCLTACHAVAAMLGCDGKHYREVCAMADSDIFEVLPAASGCQVEDVLCFYYYAGVAYAALKKWSKATDSFSMVLVTPSAALSAVAMAAERWRILCSLMAAGKPPSMPVAASQGMARSLADDVRPFTRIAEAFVTLNPTALAEALKAEEEALAASSLTGLAAQLHRAQQARVILGLTSTFVTITTAEIAEKLGLGSAADAEALVFDLVRAGTLRASIDQERGVVSFLDDDATADPAMLVKRVESLVGAAAALADAIATRERDVVLSPDCVKHATMRARGRVSAEAGRSGAMAAAAGGADADVAEAMRRSTLDM